MLPQNRLVLGRSTDAALSDCYSVARREHNVDQGVVRQLLEYLPRFVPQPGAFAKLRPRLPQHIGQKARQDARLDPFLFLVPDASELQIRLRDAECGLGLGELHVSTPEFFRTAVRHVVAQPITTLTESCPLPPAIDSFPGALCKAIALARNSHEK